MFNPVSGTQQVLNNVIYCYSTMQINPRGREDLRPLAMVTCFTLEKNPKSNAPPSIPPIAQLPRESSMTISLIRQREYVTNPWATTILDEKRILDKPKSLLYVNNFVCISYLALIDH